MKISMIVAFDKNNVIGVDGDLPWRLPDDWRFFRRTTLGKPVIMGRKTFESIGKPLSKRHNIILTHNREYEVAGAVVVHDMAAALAAAESADEAVDEVMVMGGEAIYRLFLPYADRLYLTYVDVVCQGDTLFPVLDSAEWKELSRLHHPIDEKHPYAFDWVVLERLNPVTL